MTPSLETLGWTPALSAAFDGLGLTGVVPGRVALEHNHVFRVLTAEGECLAESSGRLKHRAEGRRALPVVGDWVAIRPDPAGGRAQIRAVLPRQSWFSRKAAGRDTEEQIVAANIDTVLVVFGLDKAVNARAIERYLVVAQHSQASPVVVLNKADLAADVGEAVAEAERVTAGAPVVAACARTGLGFEAIERYLVAGRTLAVIGPSGAGKSSIVNRLVDREVLPTGEVRPWDSRGRHTSVHRQLVVRARGGLIIDTPGMRELQLWDSAAVAEAFTDIAALAESCRFRDCRHDREPGCAVKAAVDAGVIDADRYQGFLKLQTEEDDVQTKRTERERSGRVAQKSMRAFQKARGRQE